MKRTIIPLLTVTLLALLAANLLFGSISIPPGEVLAVFTGKGASSPAWEVTILQTRLPGAITALLCGAGLAASGLMLQTAFNNPLAGPSVLGINAGASLGVALVMLVGGGTIATGAITLTGFLAVVAGAFVGAMTVMGVILLLSTVIRSSVMLLIAGIMIGYATSSLIALLNFFATAEGVHSYMVWGMGNFGGVSLQQLPWFASVTLLGIAIAIALIKPLNALLLGTRYAENLGVNIRRVRALLLIATGLLSAITTAFCGPVAFIGLAVPHLARLALGSSNHNTLMPVTILMGAAIALLCNLLCVLPGSAGIIPLNAVTPIMGAPVIIYVIINQNKIQYFK